MLSQIETVQFEPNCIKTGVLMLWMQHKKAWRKKSVKIFKRSDDGFERLDYRCLKKNDVYKSLSLHGLISARMIFDKVYKTVILLTLSDERTLQLAIKDSSDLDGELDEWLQCIKTTCWGNDREILSQPLTVATSENVYEQPEAVEYCSGGSGNSSNLSKAGSVDLYQSVDDSQENEIYTPSSEYDHDIGCIFKVTIKDTESARACNLQGPYALEVKHDGLTLRNYETRAAIFEWKLEFIRRFGAINKQKVFRFEAGRRCVGYAGLFEFYSDQYTNIPKVIRECVNRHKIATTGPSKGSQQSVHTPPLNPPEKPSHDIMNGNINPSSVDDNLYSKVDDLKKQTNNNESQIPNNRPASIASTGKPSQPSRAPTLPSKTGQEELYQEPNLYSEDEYDVNSLRTDNSDPNVTPSGHLEGRVLHHRLTSNSSDGNDVKNGGTNEDYYEELHNATSGTPNTLRGSPASNGSMNSTPNSSEDEVAAVGGLYSNIDISADHSSGTIIRTKASSDNRTSTHSGDSDNSQTENFYDITPACEEEKPPEPPTRRSSCQPVSYQYSSEVPRAPFPCNIPRPPGLLQMLNVPRHHSVKSNLPPRHFSDQYS